MLLRPNVRFKLQYFDRNIIRSNWKRMNRHPLAKVGLLVRKIARGSIRRRVNRHRASPRGTPPFSHQAGRNPPFKQIYSVPQNFTTSVVVGMIGYHNSNQPVPGRHEHGMTVPLNIARTSHGRVIGHVRRTAHYPERKFMKPALRKAQPLFPAMWANSLRK